MRKLRSVSCLNLPETSLAVFPLQSYYSLVRPDTNQVLQTVQVIKTSTIFNSYVAIKIMLTVTLLTGKLYLEKVELIVIKNAVVVQVRHFKDSC